MSNSHFEGDFSFESVNLKGSSESYQFPTLRDTIAMAAVSGILSHPETRLNTPHSVAEEAYNVADAMMLRRQS